MESRLRLWQVLFDDFPGLRGYPVWEAHLELHYQVPTLGGVLGVGEALAPYSLGRARFDDIIAGQWDHPVVEGGNVHGTATQRLQNDGGGGGIFQNTNST